MIGLVITEIVLFSLSLGATTFITMAYTHLPFQDISVGPPVIGALVLYSVRLMIRQAIRRENRVHYRRLKNDEQIKLYTEPKKSNIWRWIIGLLILIVLFLTYHCMSLQGSGGIGLPMNLN